ncbi:MAG TPA: hypothetical protein VFI26_09365 [Lysobacter sp.]|jgi:hypothetical protein|nr:hypothetical protein [Lysobacter sp.]
MRLTTFPNALAALALGVVSSQLAQAATQSRTASAQGGTACQLSIPTTDTKVRPKAIGFRNEGTTNAFVICGFPMPDDSLTQFNMTVMSLDGLAHQVTCTGVNGVGYNTQPLYSTKATSTPTNTTTAYLLSWNAADFGGTGGANLPRQGYFSATCILPGQVSISTIYVSYQEDVGS